MAVQWQLAIDCRDPQRLVRFWSAALGYQVEAPPRPYATWNDYYRSIGVPDDELPTDVDAADALVDPDGAGPRIWFQQVPENKQIKNRLHIDVRIGGGRSVPLDMRRERVDTEVRRLTAEGATTLRVLAGDDLDHYAVTMQDPEGNEFCIT